METLVNFFTTGNAVIAGLAAIVCGVALLYLVMQRTIKHRENTKDVSETP